MKLNTHDRTPRPKDSSLVKVLFLIGAILVFTMFGMGSFACIYYAHNIVCGIYLLLLILVPTATIFLHIKDVEKAYVEINGNEIHVVDYSWGIKKEQHFTFSDITSAEICIASSHKVKGSRLSFAGMRYIVLMKNDQYLFKIIYLPETEEIFNQYL